MRLILQLILRLAFRLRVVGDLTSLIAGKALVVANHDSILDGALLGLFLPSRAWVVVARDDMASGLNRFLMRFVHSRVLDLSEPATVKRMVRLLDGGGLLVMFPQGRVTATASGMKLYHSVATIATRSGAPIVPVTLDGLLYSQYSRTPGDFPRRRLPRVTIRVFDAVRLPEFGAISTRLKRRKAADALSAIMQRAAFDTRRRETLFEAFVRAVENHSVRQLRSIMLALQHRDEP